MAVFSSEKGYCIFNVNGYIAGLAFDVPTRYFLHTEYNGDNMTHSDKMWDSINLDAMVIAPTIEWAQDMGLTDSWDFPWDPKRKIYFMKVIHQLHCLVSKRLYWPRGD